MQVHRLQQITQFNTAFALLVNKNMVATGYITVLLTVYLYVLQGEPGEPGRSGQKVTTRASLTDTRQLALAMKTGRWCTFNPTVHYTQYNTQRLLTLSVVSASCLAAQDEIC